MKALIKVGFCVAYDWEMLRISLPIIYKDADIICLSLDSHFISWSGEQFYFEETAFQEFINKTDTEKKIKVYRDNFHLRELSPMENEARQRNLIARFLEKGGWHVQLDCDEYFLQFSDFVSQLQSMNRLDKRFNVCCPLVNVFKKVSGGYLFIDPLTEKEVEYIQIATLEPNYLYGRRNDYFNVYVNYTIIHQSWARSEDEIRCKIENWGHHKDFDIDTFFKRWINLNETNYQEWKNFHPINPPVWPALALFKTDTLQKFIDTFDVSVFPRMNYWQRLFKNSLLISRIKFAWKFFL